MLLMPQARQCLRDTVFGQCHALAFGHPQTGQAAALDGCCKSLPTEIDCPVLL